MKKPTVDERRAEILDGAIQVLIERGFANTRVADVAKRLDVSTSLIHYHFESKETLLAEAFAQAANQDIAELEADIDAAPTAVGKLDALIRNYVPEGSDDVEWMLWIDAWGEALRNPELRTISQRLDAESLAQIERVLRIGVESGEFTCADVPGAAMRTWSMIWSAVNTPSWAANCTASPSIKPVRRMAAPGTSAHVNSPLSTPMRSTRAIWARDSASRRWLIVRSSGLRSASPQASIHSIHSTSSEPSGT